MSKKSRQKFKYLAFDRKVLHRNVALSISIIVYLKKKLKNGTEKNRKIVTKYK